MTKPKTKTIAKKQTTPPIPEAVGKLQQIAGAADSRFFDMQDSIRAALLALVAASNVVLVGPPGTAKTALLKFLAACVTDAKVWEMQFHSETRKSDMAGERDILALQEGRIGFTRDNTMVDCDIAVADEIFKGPGQTLNGSLSLFHPEERSYRAQEVGGVVRAPLRSVFAASNEFPQGIAGRRKGTHDMTPLYDRFQFRVITEQVTSHAKRRAILALGRQRRAGTLAAPPTITLAEVAAMGDAAVGIDFPVGVEAMLFQAVDELRGRKINLTTRKEEHIAYALQASALICGRHQVSLADLRIVLPCTAWDTPEERGVVQEVLSALGNDADQMASLLVDRLTANLANMSGILAGWTRPGELSMEQLTDAMEPFSQEFRDVTDAWEAMDPKHGPLDPAGFEASRKTCGELTGEGRARLTAFLDNRERLIEADSTTSLGF